MATILRRGDLQWQVKIRVKGHKPVSKTFNTRDDAKRWATDVESEMGKGVYQDRSESEGTTLHKALETYDAIAQKNKGYEAERYRIDMWKGHDLAKRTIASLKTKDFDEYRDKRRDDDVSDATIRNDLAVIAAIFKHTDYGVPNPTVRTVKTLATAKKRSRRLAAEEEKYLMAQLEDTQCSDSKRANLWIPVITRFAIETAARLSEIIGKDKTKTEEGVPGLLWENVNIEKSICKLIDTKNGLSRFVPLSPAAIKCLQQAKILKDVTAGPVFHTTVSAIKQAWQRAKKRAQAQYKNNGGTDVDFLVDFRFHDNRHEAASRWARTFERQKLMMITGHKDGRSLDRYVNADEDDVALIAATMAATQKPSAKKGGFNYRQIGLSKR